MARLFVAALENRMRHLFATNDDLNRQGDSLRDALTATQTIAHAANDTASAAHSKALEVEKTNEYRWEHADGRWNEALKRLDKATDKMETLLERLIRLESAHR